MKDRWFKEMADELTKISWRSDMRKVLERILGKRKNEVGRRWKIGELRKGRMSQKKVSEFLKIDRKTVRKWEGEK